MPCEHESILLLIQTASNCKTIDLMVCIRKDCLCTVDSHSSLCAGQKVSEEPLSVVRLGRGLTQTVDEDGGAAVRLQHRADESLEKDEELLVLGWNAHLQREVSKVSVRGWFGLPSAWMEKETPLNNDLSAPPQSHCPRPPRRSSTKVARGTSWATVPRRGWDSVPPGPPATLEQSVSGGLHAGDEELG